MYKRTNIELDVDLCYQKANMQCFRNLEIHRKRKRAVHDLCQI